MVPRQCDLTCWDKCAVFPSEGTCLQAISDSKEHMEEVWHRRVNVWHIRLLDTLKNVLILIIKDEIHSRNASYWNPILRWKFSHWDESIRLHPDLTENICEFVYRRVWERCEGIMFAEDTAHSFHQTKPIQMKEIESKMTIKAYYFGLLFSFGSLYQVLCIGLVQQLLHNFPHSSLKLNSAETGSQRS